MAEFEAYNIERAKRRQAVEDAAAALVTALELAGSSRSLSLAITKAEEAAMWAARHFGAK